MNFTEHRTNKTCAINGNNNFKYNSQVFLNPNLTNLKFGNAQLMYTHIWLIKLSFKHKQAI